MAGIGVALEGGDSIRVGELREGRVNFPFHKHIQAFSLTSTLPPHSLAQMVGKDPGGGKSQPRKTSYL